MFLLILKAIGLLGVVFGIGALFGGVLAGGRRRSRRTVQSQLQFESAEILPFPPTGGEARSEAAKPSPQPVSYLDAAAEHFTNGIVQTPTPNPSSQLGGGNGLGLERQSSYAPLQPSARLDNRPSNVVIERADSGLQKHASSLAGMTPESVAAAVEQAGSGLSPVRLEAPQGRADDLTLLSGLSIEDQATLNNLGIFHFWQIAGWSPENVAWMTRQARPMRIARENWMNQAARLAKLA